MLARRLLLVCGATSLLICGLVYAASPRSLTATIDRVSDGDTLVAITENGATLRIPLLDIDAYTECSDAYTRRGH